MDIETTQIDVACLGIGTDNYSLSPPKKEVESEKCLLLQRFSSPAACSPANMY